MGNIEKINCLLKQVDKLKLEMEKLCDHESIKEKGNGFDAFIKYEIKYKNKDACFKFHPLKNAEEKIKKAYIRQLIILSLLHAEGLQENQYAYIAKLCNSIRCSVDIQETIRLSLEKPEILINEFCTEFVDNEFKRCWILDALILIGLNADIKQRDFLVEIIYVLSVTLEEANYLMCVVDAYLKNDRSKFRSSLQYQISILNKDCVVDYAQYICSSKMEIDVLIGSIAESCPYCGAKKQKAIVVYK